MNIQLKSIGELAATLTAGAVAVKAKNPALKGAATLAAAVMTVLVWWKNQPITEAAVQGQQMIDSIKVAQRYGNAQDMPAGATSAMADEPIGDYMAADDDADDEE